MQHGEPRSEARRDIQVLRAVAVGAVLLYHLWPAGLTGGYTGVDVFFVISGFLITSHLLRSLERPGGIRLGRFWASRARRLLPLSCFVLLCTVGLTLAMLPASSWIPALRNVIASALYVQNWKLAGDSVDYLARDYAPSPTQHFWSLSVEEQFYLVWPLLIAGAALVAVRVAQRRAVAGSRGPHRPTSARVAAVVLPAPLLLRRAAFRVIAAVFVVSLGYSLWATAAEPGIAYFSTATRAWEFAAGGLVAFMNRDLAGGTGRTVRIVACWLGSALIVVAMLLPAGTPFPGTAALLPVIGAGLFVWAGEVPGAITPASLSGSRSLVYVGDISYGIYLWHWPLIVAMPYVLGAEPGLIANLLVLALTLALAAASKVVIEDPFRYGTWWSARTRRSFYPALIGVTAVTVLCTVTLTNLQQTPAPVAMTLPIDVAQPAGDAGRIDAAGVVVTGGGGGDNAAADGTVDAAPGTAASISAAGPITEMPALPDLTPTIATRGIDHGGMYDCFDFDGGGPRICPHGPDDAPVSIALIGDSHAAQYIPPLLHMVADRGWKLTTINGMNCDGGLAPACAGGEEGFQAVVDGQYDLVLYSAFRGSGTPESDVADYLTRLHDAAVYLLPIADVPLNPQTSFDCVDRSGGDAAEAAACTTPLADALTAVPDRVAPIADSLGVPYVDLTDVFCTAASCRTVIGNVVVYQDTPSSHLTATMSNLLQPRLAAAIDAALAARPTG